MEQSRFLEDGAIKHMVSFLSGKIESLSSLDTVFIMRIVKDGEKLIKAMESDPNPDVKAIVSTIKWWQDTILAMGFTYTIDKDAILALINFTPESFGARKLIMLFLQYKSRETGIVHFTSRNLFQKIFPWGFIPDETLHEAWLMQKIDGLNAIDSPLYYKSLIP